MAFWMLTGRNVFEGPTPIAILTQHARDAAPAPSSLSETAIPPELDRIVLECLAKEPDGRPASALDLFRLLEGVPVRPWTPERAQQWWDLHIPEPGSPGRATPGESILAPEDTTTLLQRE
ncbi:MAG: hypothetical protein P8049_08560 [Gemmatimonadota bacterium]